MTTSPAPTAPIVPASAYLTGTPQEWAKAFHESGWVFWDDCIVSFDPDDFEASVHLGGSATNSVLIEPNDMKRAVLAMVRLEPSAPIETNVAYELIEMAIGYARGES